MVDELEKNKIIDTELAEMDRVKELEKTRYGIEEKNSLMAINETRSVNESGRVCHVIGNNSFDFYNPNIINNLYISLDEFSFVSSSSGMKTLYIPIIGGNTYTVQKVSTNIFRVASSYDIPNSNVPFSVRVSSSLSQSLTIHTFLNDRYLSVSYMNSSTSISESEILQSIMINVGDYSLPYEPYEGCLYGLELYDTIEPNFITDNYYINCGIISIFLALIILIVNAPFIFIRKIKGN